MGCSRRAEGECPGWGPAPSSDLAPWRVCCPPAGWIAPATGSSHSVTSGRILIAPSRLWDFSELIHGRHLRQCLVLGMHPSVTAVLP